MALLFSILIVVFSLSGCACYLAYHASTAAKVAPAKTAAPIRADDRQIARAVKKKLLADQGLKAVNVDVASTKGRVTLRGPISSAQQGERLVAVARRVPGVRTVESKLYMD